MGDEGTKVERRANLDGRGERERGTKLETGEEKEEDRTNNGDLMMNAKCASIVVVGSHNGGDHHHFFFSTFQVTTNDEFLNEEKDCWPSSPVRRLSLSPSALSPNNLISLNCSLIRTRSEGRESVGYT